MEVFFEFVIWLLFAGICGVFVQWVELAPKLLKKRLKRCKKLKTLISFIDTYF